MRKKIFGWLGREFVSLSGEAREGENPADQVQAILKSFETELQAMSLSFDNTVRTRLWARDAESRRSASAQRNKILSGKARSSSSSFIAPNHFDSRAQIALDLLAMRASKPGAERTLTEYSPPVSPLRFLTYDSIVFLSGVTAQGASLAEQTAKIVNAISDSLSAAKSSWDKVVKASCLLHSSQRYDKLKELFDRAIRTNIPLIDCSFVDGYAAEGNLLEIEITATI